MSILEWLDFLFYWLQDARLHFVVSACLGLLAWWQTLTMLSASWYFLTLWFSTTRKGNTVAGCCILLISLAAGCAIALSAHAGLDYLQQWLSKPLGPGLNLQRPEV